MSKQGSPHTQGTDFKPWETHGSIKNLLPGKTYVFRIQAETRIGYGPETIWKQKMPILGRILNLYFSFIFLLLCILFTNIMENYQIYLLFTTCPLLLHIMRQPEIGLTMIFLDQGKPQCPTGGTIHTVERQY